MQSTARSSRRKRSPLATSLWQRLVARYRRHRAYLEWRLRFGASHQKAKLMAWLTEGLRAEIAKLQSSTTVSDG